MLILQSTKQLACNLFVVAKKHKKLKIFKRLADLIFDSSHFAETLQFFSVFWKTTVWKNLINFLKFWSYNECKSISNSLPTTSSTLDTTYVNFLLHIFCVLTRWGIFFFIFALGSEINVGSGINVGLGKFRKNNKRRVRNNSRGGKNFFTH